MPGSARWGSPGTRDRLRLSVAVTATLLVLAAAGCSGDTGPDIPRASGSATSSSGSSGSTGSSPTPAVVDGVSLTGQGSTLAVGQTATVSYQPRQGETGVFDVTVTRLEKTSFAKSFVGWDIPSDEQASQPYFVRATVVNRGTLDLGKRPVPLYIVDGSNTLIEATTFASTFKACKPGHFPDAFPTGATADVCLVFLAPKHGALDAVSFRPTQAFDPITWTGPLEKPEATAGSGAGKGSKGGAGAGKG